MNRIDCSSKQGGGSTMKWQNVFNLYGQLLNHKYSTIINRNQFYALSKLEGAPTTICEADKPSFLSFVAGQALPIN